MEVRHRFAGIGSIVEHEPESILSETERASDFAGFKHEMPQNLMILRRRFRNPRDRLLRNDQDVRWGLGFDVAKSNHQLVFVNDRRRNFAGDDLLKQGLTHAAANCLVAEKTSNGSRGERHIIWNPPRCLDGYPGLKAWRGWSQSVHEQGTLKMGRLGAETFAKKLENFFLQGLAAVAPAAGAGQLFDAAAQTVKAHHAGFLFKLMP
jgi:hypothetical protein